MNYISEKGCEVLRCDPALASSSAFTLPGTQQRFTSFATGISPSLLIHITTLDLTDVDCKALMPLLDCQPT